MLQWITFISQKSSALCSLLARTTDKASPCVVLIHLPKSIKKEVRTKVQPLFSNWAGVDSNHRTLAGTDLQSVAFSHSATYPYLVFIKFAFDGIWTRGLSLTKGVRYPCATKACPLTYSPRPPGSATSHKMILNHFVRQSPCATKACSELVYSLVKEKSR